MNHNYLIMNHENGEIKYTVTGLWKTEIDQNNLLIKQSRPMENVKKVNIDLTTWKRRLEVSSVFIL